jgi:hypothetical protein
MRASDERALASDSSRGVLLNQCLHREVMTSGYQPGMELERSEMDARRECRECRCRKRAASLAANAAGPVGVGVER